MFKGLKHENSLLGCHNHDLKNDDGQYLSYNLEIFNIQANWSMHVIEMLHAFNY